MLLLAWQNAHVFPARFMNLYYSTCGFYQYFLVLSLRNVESGSKRSIEQLMLFSSLCSYKISHRSISKMLQSYCNKSGIIVIHFCLMSTK